MGSEQPEPSRDPKESTDDHTESSVVRMRGVPFSADQADIKFFFAGLDIAKIHFVLNQGGRFSGEVFVQFATVQDATKAIGFDRKHMGKRYVEIYTCTNKDLEAAISKSKDFKNQPVVPAALRTIGVIKMRGLPFSAQQSDIASFFGDIRLQTNGIHLVQMSDGRSSGEAFVEFVSEEDINAAMLKNKEKIGARYIELFRLPPEDMAIAMQRHLGTNLRHHSPSHLHHHHHHHQQSLPPPPLPLPPLHHHQQQHHHQPPPLQQQHRYHHDPLPPVHHHHHAPPDSIGYARQQRNNAPYYPPRQERLSYSGGGNESLDDTFLRLRGLPFSTNEENLFAFFDRAGVAPIQIHFVINAQGRKSGEAIVQFPSAHEARRGLSLDRAMLGTRYVEVFRSSHVEFIAAIAVQPIPYQLQQQQQQLGPRPGSPGLNGYGDGYDYRKRARFE